MSARDEREPISVVERLGNVVTECVSGATRRNAPTVSVVRIGPEQVAHGAFVWHLLQSVQCSDVVQCVDRRR